MGRKKLVELTSVWDDDDDDDVSFSDIPEGCRACGGPYPDCTDSCSLFDD